jgi:hypothetical protein
MFSADVQLSVAIRQVDELIWGSDVDCSSDPRILRAKAQLFEGAAGGTLQSKQLGQANVTCGQFFFTRVQKSLPEKYRKILEELFWQGLLLQVANWFTEQNVVLVA